MSAELQRFVRESLERGIPRATIRETLRATGWRAEEVEAALAAYAEIDFPIPVPRPRPYLSAREAFLYLVLFATLYTTAFNTGVVLFKLIELLLPDPSQRWESARAAAEAARVATAGLIIAFPIFLFLARLIGQGVEREPEKRGSKVRKWLTYLTLFVAAMVIIGDLTFLVARLLSGELPVRVLLKVVVVFLIAGMVFGHYLGQLRRDEQEGIPRARWALPPRLVGLGVVAVIAIGLFLSGSPARERERQLDSQRVEDLQRLSDQIAAWAWRHRRLPASLEELMASPDATGLRFHDPVTRNVYEYRMLDSLAYELCATFTAPDSLLAPGDPASAPKFWHHSAGRACYRLTLPARAFAPDAQAPIHGAPALPMEPPARGGP